VVVVLGSVVVVGTVVVTTVVVCSMGVSTVVSYVVSVGGVSPNHSGSASTSSSFRKTGVVGERVPMTSVEKPVMRSTYWLGSRAWDTRIVPSRQVTLMVNTFVTGSCVTESR